MLWVYHAFSKPNTLNGLIKYIHLSEYFKTSLESHSIFNWQLISITKSWKFLSHKIDSVTYGTLTHIHEDNKPPAGHWISDHCFFAQAFWHTFIRIINQSSILKPSEFIKFHEHFNYIMSQWAILFVMTGLKPSLWIFKYQYGLNFSKKQSFRT